MLCIIVVYIVGNVMDLLKLKGVTYVYGRPQEILVNIYFGVCSKWTHYSNSCPSVPEQYVDR